MDKLDYNKIFNEGSEIWNMMMKKTWDQLDLKINLSSINLAGKEITGYDFTNCQFRYFSDSLC
jgi:hypothetical protein